MKRKRTVAVTLLLLAVMLCTGCSAPESAQQNSAPVSFEDLFAAATREDLAKAVNCKPEEFEQIMIYSQNLNKILPDADYVQPEKFERGVTEEDDLVWVSAAELRTMIKPILITTENWKDYFEARVDQSEWYDLDDDGNEVLKYSDCAAVDIKKGYYFDWSGLRMQFVNNENGETFFYSSGWGEFLGLQDGKVCTITYDDDFNEEYHEFNIDNYTCVMADGVIYEYNIPDEIISVGLFVEENGDENYRYFRLADCPYEFNESDEFVCVLHEGDEYPWYIGYSMLGEDIYER